MRRRELGTEGSTDPIILFYQGRGTDRDGRSLEDILRLDHAELEVDHRFIAWLFPTPEKSSFGFFTPQITDRGVKEFRSSPELRAQLGRAFRFILDFYGLRLADGDDLVVVEASTFSYRARDWVTDGNHNFLRISRILRSLEHLGLAAEASRFLAYLEDLYDRRSDAIGSRTLAYWRLRASGSGDHLPEE